VKLGIPSRRPVPFPSALGDKVAHLYVRGKTIDKAAAAVGVTAFIARNMLLERGIERRTGESGVYLPSSTRRRQASMVRLYQQGKTFREIANVFQTSTTSVQRALDRHGIARRGRGNGARHR
jgi:transposase